MGIYATESSRHWREPEWDDPRWLDDEWDVGRDDWAARKPRPVVAPSAPPLATPSHEGGALNPFAAATNGRADARGERDRRTRSTSSPGGAAGLGGSAAPHRENEGSPRHVGGRAADDR